MEQDRLPTTQQLIRQVEERYEALEPHFRNLIANVVAACTPPDDLSWTAGLLERLAALDALRSVVDETLRLEIQELRRWDDVGWPEIAGALGVSRQAARQRYQHSADAVVADLDDLFEAEAEELKGHLEVELARLRIEFLKAKRPEEDLEAESRAVRDRFMKERVSPLMTRHLERRAAARADFQRKYDAADGAA